MKVDEMRAGPQLDALMAEKVMGWRECYGECGSANGFPPGSKLPHRVPNYSVSIAAAWEVVRKMMEMPDDLSWDFARHVEWACHVRTFWDYDSILHHILEEITPEIICYAALKAVGVTEVPD